MKQDISYWDNFYLNSDAKLRIPSQFAAFVATEYMGIFETIIDLGCGNGRDSLFFSSLGFEVIGVDASLKAIESIRKSSMSTGNFLHSDIVNKDLPKLIQTLIHPSNKRLIYSRFFLHAISDQQELSLWDLINTLCHNNDVLALEFRTNRDEKLAKVTDKHYRRFVNPIEVIARAADAGFVCEYFTEGFGYAKYKSDDAHVARLLLKKQDNA